jgi:hypothetical protein
MDETVKTKVVNNTQFQSTSKKLDVLALWNIMHEESTNQYAGNFASELFDQLMNLKHTGSFDQYALTFQDIVEDLGSIAQGFTPETLAKLFIRGLKSDEHQAWKEKCFMTSNRGSLWHPSTYLELIADIGKYTILRISYDLINAPDEEGSTEDDEMQAYAASTQHSSNRYARQDKQKGGKQRSGTDFKPRDPCWNCSSADCPRGKNCKFETSAYCGACQAENWYQTENHDACVAAKGKRNIKRAVQERSPAFAPTTAPAFSDHAVPSDALAYSPHLNYAAQTTVYQANPQSFTTMDQTLSRAQQVPAQIWALGYRIVRDEPTWIQASFK